MRHQWQTISHKKTSRKCSFFFAKVALVHPCHRNKLFAFLSTRSVSKRTLLRKQPDAEQPALKAEGGATLATVEAKRAVLASIFTTVDAANQGLTMAIENIKDRSVNNGPIVPFATRTSATFAERKATLIFRMILSRSSVRSTMKTHVEQSRSSYNGDTDDP